MRIYCGYEIEFLPFYDLFQMNILFVCYEISRTGQLTVASEQALLPVRFTSYVNLPSPCSSVDVTTALITTNKSSLLGDISLLVLP